MPGMDADTRRDLGGIVLGAVALLVGLVVRAGDAQAADAIGGAFLLGGLLVVAILGIRVGTRLARN